MAGEEDIKRRTTENDPFFRTEEKSQFSVRIYSTAANMTSYWYSLEEEKSQFSPDVTPLILAAQYNNHVTMGH